MPSFLDHALALAGFGYRVFPLAPGGQEPALPTDWKQIATTDPDKIRHLWIDPITGWEQPYNVGVACGKGLLVVDIDVKDGTPLDQATMVLELMHGELPETFYVDTPSGGRHYYFSVEPGVAIPNSIKRITKHADIKGDDGYVVGRGSERPDGVYAGKGNPALRAAAPAKLVEACMARARKPVDNAPVLDAEELDTESAIERAKSWLLGSAPDHGTYTVAARVKDFGISQPKCLELVDEHWNEAKGLGKSLDHIEFRVANAYRYGQSPVGIASPEAEFEPVEVEDRRTKPTKGKLYYERWKEAHASQPAPYLVKGWYDLGAMVVTYGESNSGKTNVVLAQAVAIASGEPWCESRTRQGLVVYVAAEGGRGVRKRISAHHLKYGKADIPFALVPCPIDLLRPTGDTKALIELVRNAESDFGQKCVMVVLDTLSRVLAGGNENAPDDMGALVIHCDRIREATGATVHLIHHSGKNIAAGARGHSLLRAATDTEVEVADKMVEARKQRDMETTQKAAFRYETVEIGRDEDGDPVTSIVTHCTRPTEFEEKLTEAQERMRTVLTTLVRKRVGLADGEPDKPDIMSNVQIGSRAWKSALGLRQGDRNSDKEFERNVAVLVRNCDIDVVAVKGRESLYNLIVRQTATNCDNP